MGFTYLAEEKPPAPFVVPSLVSLCIEKILQHRLVDDHRLVVASTRANAKDNELQLIPNVSTTYSDLPMDLQQQIMERAAEKRVVDDFWLGYFIPCINELGSLSISFCPITDAGLDLIVSGCPSLRSLDVSYCYKITGSGFGRIVDLSELRDLSVSGTNINSEALSQISRIRTLNSVNIKYCENLTYEAVKAFVMAVEDLKDFEHDPWHLDPSQTRSSPTDVLEPFLLEEEDFDPEEAYDRMVDLMDHFRIQHDRA